MTEVLRIPVIPELAKQKSECECKETLDVPPKCTNYNGDHSGSYRRCRKFPIKLKKPAIQSKTQQASESRIKSSPSSFLSEKFSPQNMADFTYKIYCIAKKDIQLISVNSLPLNCGKRDSSSKKNKTGSEISTSKNPPVVPFSSKTTTENATNPKISSKKDSFPFFTAESVVLH